MLISAEAGPSTPRRAYETWHVRAPYTTTNGRDCVKPLRLSCTGLYPQRDGPVRILQRVEALSREAHTNANQSRGGPISPEAGPSFPRRAYRGTSLIRKRLPLEPYSRPIPRAL